ncbi:MAG TPA: terminase gpA endonuclease subunit [Roseiarcus sp.]
MEFAFKHRAADIFSQAVADVLMPAEELTPSQWAEAHLTVPDGPLAGQKFSLALTEYLREPLDMLGPDSPVNEIAVMKSAQTGFTTLLIAIVGYMIDRAPCHSLLIQPTSDAAMDFNRLKLDPAIRASPALKRKVASQTSRSSEGSTTYSKQFPGGSLTLAISTSAADLRSKTVGVMLRDEIDQYPDDLDGQGSPLEISDGRLMAFLTSGEWKKADISTPTIKGGSKIERRFQAGDQRRWRVPCPGCGSEFTFEFPGLRYSETFPHKAHYVAPCCGSIIENHQKLDPLRRGRWVATEARPGAFPSYHLSALESPFVPFDAIAAERVAAGDDPTRLRTFDNLWLGIPHEVQGDSPDAESLMTRRESGHARGQIPPRGLILVGAADVQGNGIWFEVIAIAPNRETWVVEAGFLSGSTESPDGDAFEQLRERVLDRDWPDAFGRTRKLDALGVDSGFRSHVVYSWVRANRRARANTKGADTVLALKGGEGWDRPAMGLPSTVDISLAGKRVRGGAAVRVVGTFSLKSVFYEDLWKLGIKSGKPANPPGMCHFPDFLDDVYFKQLTSEYVVNEIGRNGRPRRVWRLRHGRDNHLLDCRVYNLALAEFLGVQKMTSDEWALLTRERCAPAGETLAAMEMTGAPLDEAKPERAPAGEDWRAALRRANAETLKRPLAGASWAQRKAT